MKRLKCRLKDNIKMDHGEVWCEGVEFNWLRIGHLACFYKHGNEVMGSIRAEKLLTN
jgi:hypothetical protein